MEKKQKLSMAGWTTRSLNYVLQSYLFVTVETNSQSMLSRVGTCAKRCSTEEHNYAIESNFCWFIFTNLSYVVWNFVVSLEYFIREMANTSTLFVSLWVFKYFRMWIAIGTSLYVWGMVSIWFISNLFIGDTIAIFRNQSTLIVFIYEHKKLGI